MCMGMGSLFSFWIKHRSLGSGCTKHRSTKHKLSVGRPEFGYNVPSLAASPSPPGRSSGRAASCVAKPRAEGGEGLQTLHLIMFLWNANYMYVPVNR